MPTADVPAVNDRERGTGSHRLILAKKREFEITDRLQAHALDRLADHFGKAVGRSWLMNEVFPGRPAADVHGEFDRLMLELAATAPTLGLVLVTQSAPNGATTYALLKARPRRM